MNSKILDVLFYVFAGLTVVLAICSAILEAVGTQPLWLAIVFAVSLVGLCVVGFLDHKTKIKEIK